MLCSRKSEYGWNALRARADTGLSPVIRVGVWQLAQPICRKTCPPNSVRYDLGPRGGGPSRVMKSANSSTFSPLSFKAGAGLNARTSRFPCGRFSSGNSGLVNPISFR